MELFWLSEFGLTSYCETIVNTWRSHDLRSMAYSYFSSFFTGKLICLPIHDFIQWNNKIKQFNLNNLYSFQHYKLTNAFLIITLLPLQIILLPKILLFLLLALLLPPIVKIRKIDKKWTIIKVIKKVCGDNCFPSTNQSNQFRLSWI